MLEVQRYNSSLTSHKMDISCYGFALDIKLGQKAYRDEFSKELNTAISTFYTALKSGHVIKAGPVTLQEFKTDLPANAEYHVEKVVGFPYRIGIVCYVKEGKKYFHTGIVVETGHRIYA